MDAGPGLQLLTDAAATFRLTRLVTEDVITLRPRAAVIAWAYGRRGVEDPATLLGAPLIFQERGPRRDAARRWAWDEGARLDEFPPPAAKLVTCSWCASVWLSVGVVILRRAVPRAWDLAARALGSSAAAGLVARHDR